MAVARGLAVVGVMAMCGWGAWLVTASLRENTAAMPAAAKATPMLPPILRTDGVLDDTWLARTLALPKRTSLMELDLEALRARLLADDQIVGATLTRQFPDRLIVQISERFPVARYAAHEGGRDQTLLVSRDGVIYRGSCYDPQIIESMPWIEGAPVVIDGGKYRPIPNMDTVADLLARARLEAEHLYSGWESVSLAKMDTLQRLEVRTREAADHAYLVYFSTRDDYFRQLVRLSYICDKLTEVPAGYSTTIDLTLGGRDVPVCLNPPPDLPDPSTVLPQSMIAGRSSANRSQLIPPSGDVSAVNQNRSAKALFEVPVVQPKKTKREL